VLAVLNEQGEHTDGRRSLLQYSHRALALPLDLALALPSGPAVWRCRLALPSVPWRGDAAHAAYGAYMEHMEHMEHTCSTMQHMEHMMHMEHT